MKECQVCRATYADDTLNYCLADGSQLVDSDAEEVTVVAQMPAPGAETVMMNPPHDQLRIDVSQPPSRAGQTPYQAPQPSVSGGGMSTLVKVIIGILALGVLLLLLAGVGGYVYYRMNGDNTEVANANTKQPTTPTPAKSDKEVLQEQIANLEKRLEEQKNAGKTGNVDVDVDDIPETGATFIPARVNSPGDGFLALRSLPSSELGDRILKIPHGATVYVGACGPVTPPAKNGRWCQATYSGSSGWVYDRYLIYSK